MGFDHDGAFADLDGDGVANRSVSFSTTTAARPINHAYIELGGFRIGKTDSLFTTFTDYAGGVIHDDFAVGLRPVRHPHDQPTRFDAGNGFTAAIALEEALTWTSDLHDRCYVPHVTGGVGYTGGWGSVSASSPATTRYGKSMPSRSSWT